MWQAKCEGRSQATTTNNTRKPSGERVAAELGALRVRGKLCIGIDAVYGA